MHRGEQAQPDWQDLVADEQGIAIDRNCESCGYNLRHVSLAGDCPECGTAVSASLNETHLMFAEPQWAKRVGRGAWMITVGGLFQTVALGLVMEGDLTRQYSWIMEEAQWMWPAFLVMQVAAAVMFIWAIFSFTTWELQAPADAMTPPSDQSFRSPVSTRPVSTRMRLRVLTISTPVFFFAFILISRHQSNNPDQSAIVPMILLAVTVASAIATIGTTATYASRLSDRVPRKGLSRMFRGISKYTVFAANCGLIGIVLIAVVELLRQHIQFPPLVLVALIIIMMGAVLIMPTIAILFAIQLIRLSRQMGQAIKLGKSLKEQYVDRLADLEIPISENVTLQSTTSREVP